MVYCQVLTQGKAKCMAKAVWNGVTLAESDKTQVVEENIYFPQDTVKREYLLLELDDFDVSVEGTGAVLLADGGWAGKSGRGVVLPGSQTGGAEDQGVYCILARRGSREVATRRRGLRAARKGPKPFFTPEDTEICGSPPLRFASVGMTIYKRNGISLHSGHPFLGVGGFLLRCAVLPIRRKNVEFCSPAGRISFNFRVSWKQPVEKSPWIDLYA